MEELKRQELEEIKEFFVEDGWTEGLFQFLFLLEDAKPGVYLQQEKNKKKLNQLRNMLSWFDLRVSMRHGGYATKNKELYKQWNRIFSFKLDAEKFLGYPECCVRDVTGFGGNLLLYQLYSLVKDIRYGRKTVKNIIEYLKNGRFIHHVPCKLDCDNTILLERKYEAIMLKYMWLVSDLLYEHFSTKTKGLIQLLISLKEHTQERITYDIQQLKDRNLVLRLEMNLNDILEIVINKKAARDNIAYSIKLLRSNWKCMFENFN